MSNIGARYLHWAAVKHKEVTPMKRMFLFLSLALLLVSATGGSTAAPGDLLEPTSAAISNATDSFFVVARDSPTSAEFRISDAALSLTAVPQLNLFEALVTLIVFLGLLFVWVTKFPSDRPDDTK